MINRLGVVCASKVLHSHTLEVDIQFGQVRELLDRPLQKGIVIQPRLGSPMIAAAYPVAFIPPWVTDWEKGHPLVSHWGSSSISFQSPSHSLSFFYPITHPQFEGSPGLVCSQPIHPQTLSLSQKGPRWRHPPFGPVPPIQASQFPANLRIRHQCSANSLSSFFLCRASGFRFPSPSRDLLHAWLVLLLRNKKKKRGFTTDVAECPRLDPI